MNSMLKSKAAALWCLAYFLVCGVVPVALLVSEYPPEHASTYMKVYGHFFLYPLFFGWRSAKSWGFVDPEGQIIPWKERLRQRGIDPDRNEGRSLDSAAKMLWGRE